MTPSIEALAPSQIPELQTEAINVMDRLGEHAHNVVGRMQESFDNITHSRVIRTGLAVGAVLLGPAALHPDTAEGSPIKATKSNVSNIYTPYAPEKALGSVQSSLLAGKGVVVNSLALTPSTLQAEGDCAKGSVYSLYVDAPDSLRQAKCDGSPETASPQAYIASTQSRFQPVLNFIGKAQVNAIPGFNVDIKQNTLGLAGTGDSVQTNFECPSPKSKGAAIESTTILPGDKANLTFCPSKKIIQVSNPNVNDPTYPKAIAAYKADPRLNREFGGDSYKKNLYTLCPASPKSQDPKLTLKYSDKKKSVSVGFDASSFSLYCSEVGQYSEELTTQVAKRGSSHYKTVGRSALHISGLETTLLNYGLSGKNLRERVVLPLKGKAFDSIQGKKLSMRIKITERFKGFKGQKFQHAFDGATTNMGSSSQVYKSVPKNIFR